MESRPGVITRVDDLPEDLLERARGMPLPDGVLLCPPDYFRVVDVKNPFMEGQIGRVDTARAHLQWDRLKRALEGLPLQVRTLAALPDCEDMVFAANQTFVGLDRKGQKLCVPSRMKHPSRRREVPAFVRWFQSHSHQSVELGGTGYFEGGGDAIWHPGRALVWGGHGPRSEDTVFPELARIFQVPVLLLDLITDRFYHLDTCFCPLNQETVLIYPPAFSPGSLTLIQRVFPTVLRAEPAEASELMACNAAAFLDRHVVIQRGATQVNRLLKATGLEVIEIETGEFLRSGGSVFCLKMSFWV